MDQLRTLKSLFNQSIYRIPDYQRGYAWQEEHYADFWFDLINLDSERTHYAGVLTLKPIPKSKIKKDSEEYWLVENGDELFHVIDGQQRLTTSIILIQCVFELVKRQKENQSKKDYEIIFADQNLSEHMNLFLRKIHPQKSFITYKFGYQNDNPSYFYFRHKILNEPYGGDLIETYYTLNLLNAKTYFLDQLNSIVQNIGISGIEEIFRKLITSFLFNPYRIPSEFDEYLAFETMNNRGKKLSNLELLKNRLIYLITLFNQDEADDSVKKNLREAVNDTWKDVYLILGKNKEHPLNDDEFLRAHWIIYYKYSRKKGNDYVNFLLKQQFAIERVLKKKPSLVKLVQIEEASDSTELPENDQSEEENKDSIQKILTPKEIKEYVSSLKEVSSVWYHTWFPYEKNDYSELTNTWLDKINRLGCIYFRPLITTILLSKRINNEEKIDLLKEIERFLFVVFRMNRVQSSYGSSEFYKASRQLYHGEIGYSQLKQQFADSNKFLFDEYGNFKNAGFKQLIQDKFDRKNGTGFYGWSGLNYFLYEYELHLMRQRNTPKIDWNIFTRYEKDKYSIEHIYPQDSKVAYWNKMFKDYSKKQKQILLNSLGNLLPLSLSINISLQNDSFLDKKKIKYDKEQNIIRNGYENGSYSEIEVSKEEDWTADNIKERGLRLLSFLEKRWNIRIGSHSEKIEILNLSFIN